MRAHFRLVLAIWCSLLLLCSTNERIALAKDSEKQNPPADLVADDEAATTPAALTKSEDTCSVFGTGAQCSPVTRADGWAQSATFHGPLTLCAALLDPLKAELALGAKPRLSARLPDDDDVDFTDPITPDRFFQLQQLYPPTDRLGGVLHPTCAVVGPSGALLLHNWGEEIDRAAAVFRFNGAPAATLPEELQRHTGTRTTYRIVRPAFNATHESDETCVLIPDGPKAVNDAVRADAKRRASHRHQRHGTVTISPHFVTHVAALAGQSPSLALLAIMLAGHMCKSVKVYGVGQMERHGARWHYYDGAMAPVWTPSFASDVNVWLRLEAAFNHSISVQGNCFVKCIDSLAKCAACWEQPPLQLFERQRVQPELDAAVSKAVEQLSPALKRAATEAASAAHDALGASWGLAIHTGAVDVRLTA